MNKFKKSFELLNVEKHHPDAVSQLVAGLQSDNRSDNDPAQWTQEFAASGKGCQVVGVHEPIWTEKLASCDKSGKVTDRN